MRWLVFLPAAILALYSTTVEAQTTYGLTAVGYTITQVPPTQSDVGYVTCGSETKNNINRSFDGEPFQQCGDDLFMIHYTGFITMPVHESIQFWLAADDGGTMKIADYEWGDWTDKGCTAIETPIMSFSSGESVAVDGWFYENGGGTCFMLAWNIDGQGWEIVPDEAFRQVPVSTTSTTSTTTTSTTTTEVPTTTTEPVVPSTTSTTMPESTTTTVVVSSSSQPSPTTTAIPIATTTTVQQNTSTMSTSTSVAPLNTSIVSTQSSVTANVTTTTAETTSVLAPVASTTTIQTQTPQQGSNTAEAVLTALVGGVSNDEAKTIVLDEKALEVLDKTDAEAVFEALRVDELSDSELVVLVATVQQASVVVREAFEEKVNMFNGKVDSYVPLGSSVPVSSRRVLIAISAAMTAMPTPTRKSR